MPNANQSSVNIVAVISSARVVDSADLVAELSPKDAVVSCHPIVTVGVSSMVEIDLANIVAEIIAASAEEVRSCSIPV